MIRTEEKVGKLLRWILVEAYKSGLTRLKRNRQPDESGTETSGDYYIYRHDIYQRFFRLANDPLRQEAGAVDEGALRSYRRRRLKSAVILCESVRELLKNGLIQFPRGAVSEESRMNHWGGSTNFISLTEAGIKKAESILTLE
jgi:hypothetical protein